MIQVELEKRLCPSCNKFFKVMVKSNQHYCSQFCEGKNLKWVGLKNLSKDGESTPKLKPVKNIGKTLKNHVKSKEIITLNIEKKETHKKESTMQEQEKKAIDENKNGLSETMSSIWSTEESTTKSVQAESESSESNLQSSEIQLTDSQNLPIDLSEGILHSMNMLKSTSDHLFSLMTNLNHKSDARLHEVDRVQAASECGKQIISAIRMQHDILKLAKEMGKK